MIPDVIHSAFIEKPKTSYKGFLARHGVVSPPQGEPDVHPSKDAAPIWFTKEMQILSWNMMDMRNDVITKDGWGVVFERDTCFTNEQGWGLDVGTGKFVKRADHVNGLYLEYDDPKLMKRIIMGGSLYMGIVEGNEFVMYPGHHGIDVNKPMPSPREVFENGWFFYAVTVWTKTKAVAHFPQGSKKEIKYYGPVVIPNFIKERTPYPLEWFRAYDSDAPPDPLAWVG